MASIALNRLVIITKPHMYKTLFRSLKLALFIAIPWIVPSFGLMICTLSGIGDFGYDPGDFACTAIDTPCNRFALSLYITVIAFPIPLVVIIISYAWIYIHLKRHFEKQKRSNTSTQNVTTNSIPTTSSFETDFNGPDNSRKELSQGDPIYVKILATRQKKHISQQQIKITKNLFTVVCGFLLCFLPYFILIFVENSEHVLFYIKVITYANCAINFPIYSLKHPDFKVVLQCIIKHSFDEIPQPSKFLKFFLSKEIWLDHNLERLNDTYLGPVAKFRWLAWLGAPRAGPALWNYPAPLYSRRINTICQKSSGWHVLSTFDYFYWHQKIWQ